MASRRTFLRASLAAAATGAAPSLTWADAGAPHYLAAGRKADGRYVLCGLTDGGELRFEIALPGRGHAAAAHPHAPLAVAFARRPGTFALVIDCALGVERARLEAPAGRHFYGHGAFDAEGARLYTCENAYETGDGCIGVWDATNGFRRLGEFPSGGVGPHELVFDQARGRLVVANGGVRTHPDSGRAKLNLPTMRSNLAYLDPDDGRQISILALDADLRLNSLRHLALDPYGAVGVAMQWQGNRTLPVPLVATHQFGDAALVLLSAPEMEQLRLQGYGGSVSFSIDGRSIGLTSPRGGRLHVFSTETGELVQAVSLTDVCGIAPHADGFFVSDGLGRMSTLTGCAVRTVSTHVLSWDNHLIKL